MRKLISYKRLFYAVAAFAVLQHIHSYFGVPTEGMMVSFTSFCIYAALTTLLLDTASFLFMRAVRRWGM